MNKDFISNFEEKVRKSIRQHNLVSADDKVLVACSGGKDSTTALYLLKKFGYPTEALIIDLLMGEFSKKNLANIKKFCQEQGIKLHIVSIRDEFSYKVCYIQSVLKSKGRPLNSCTICGILKRNILNRKARELGFTKLVTGHNLDDEAQTIFMNLMQGNLSFCAKLGPEVGQIKDEKFIPRIKPLYFCLEKDIKEYSQLKNFPVLYEPCPCSVNAFRTSVKRSLNSLEKEEPQIKKEIVKNFIRILPALKEDNKTEQELKYCKICGEPAKSEICQACKMMRMLGE